jgi:hypothetical protein
MTHHWPGTEYLKLEPFSSVVVNRGFMYAKPRAGRNFHRI